MPDDIDDLLASLRAGIEKRVREQLARHLKVNPNAEYGQIVQIQVGQEKEKLERMAEKLENEDHDAAAELVRALGDEWLPELSRQLQRR